MISYLLTRGLVAIFWLIPFRLLYVLSDGLSWLLFKFGYRSKVVLGNLRRCFPDKNETEIQKIARESYRNLTDIKLESLKATTTPLEEIRRRYTYSNYSLINEQLKLGRSVMLVGGHFNNWEWGVITIANGIEGNTIGVYKPLTNKHIDRWFYSTRARDGRMILKSMKETFAAVEQYKTEPTVFILVGDQSPSNRATAQWIEFFGQETACLPGTDVISRTNDFPVFYYHTRRLKRGFYNLSFEKICLDPTKTQTGEITQMFMSHLETKIRESPASWLWSHKRWKMKPEPEKTGV